MDINRHTLSWALSEGHLHGRMSFIAGPRQIGKTTSIQRFLKSRGQERFYYNWDSPVVKKRFAVNPAFLIEDLPLETEKTWVSLDEIHKYPKWKNILKGYYDEWKDQIQFVVTGSARLDFFRKSGDSLVGRYFLFHLLPLGVGEVLGRPPLPIQEPLQGWALPSVPLADEAAHDGIQSLLRTSGFPEPFSVGTADFTTRWREDHFSLILREDLRDLTKISEIRRLETLLYLLPERIGSPLSLNSLKQPLECAHATITSWLNALQKVYLVFSISPWTARISRSILKEEKYYFWDWGMVPDGGPRFENFIAVQLQRAVAAWNEWGKGPFRLYYLRTKDGREADFAIADRKRVHLIVEAKESDEALSPHLPYFREKTGAELAVQVINKKQFCIRKDKNLWVMGTDRFLSMLP